MRRRLVGAALGLVALVGVAAGCGLPVDGSPRAIPRSEVPAALFAPNPVVSQQVPHVPTGTAVPVQLWFLDSTKRLKPVPRAVRRPATVQTVLDALEEGPIGPELSERLASDVPQNAGLISSSLRNRIATIELGPVFSGIPATQSIYAYAQIVYSVTNLPGVKGVLFEFAGSRLPAEIASGAVVYRPVSRHDYRQLVAR